MTDREIDLAFGVDDRYVPHLAAMIASVVRHAPGARFRIIVLCADIPESRRRQVESVAPNARFVWVDVGDEDVPAFAGEGRSGLEHLSRGTLFRLGLERLAPADCRRLLYLDSDMIVLGDLREIYDADLGEAPLGAVRDAYLDAAEFGRRWGLPANGTPYLNAGLLLIDLERVRAEGLFSKAARFVAENGDKLPYNDQDALNWACWGRWAELPPRWNAQRFMVVPGLAPDLPEELRYQDRLPSLVHFTGPGKPWTPGFYHPWHWIYWDNLARTPFLDEVAASAQVSVVDRFKLWLRWMRRRPWPRPARGRQLASGS